MAKNISLSEKEIKALLWIFDLVSEDCDGLLDFQKKLYRKFVRALKPIKVSSRKSKGRGLQKYVCSKLAEVLKIDYQQDNDNCEIHSKEMGQSGTDIVLRGVARERIKFDIECKNTEKLNLYKTIEQSKLNTQNGRNWLVVHKKNQHKPITILDFEVFVSLLKRSIANA